MTSIKLYNTLSKKKDTLKPRKNKSFNFFVCGPTVYDSSHIGHARTYIIFDCLVKYLNHLGFKVFYLQNITDIDDKIVGRAREKEVSAKYLAEVFYKKHLGDMKKLGINSVTKYVKATSHIKEIISQIQRLLDKGYAYTLSDGVYFDISKFKNYGKLSGRTVLQAEDSTSRIDYSRDKKNRGDFCLWKLNEHKQEPSWPSPFGRGRPGWHIEDTAITEKFFGAQYDIHGGARDLIFPHHEAEISQMEAISGKRPMAKYWLHTGFLTISSQKMSKSLNNFVTIDEFLRRNPYQLLRFWVAKNLWRSPIDYSESSIMETKSNVFRIEDFLRKIKYRPIKNTKADPKIKKAIAKHIDAFYKHLADDFNTPKAFSEMFELITQVNKSEDSITKKEAQEILSFFEDINRIFDIIDFNSLRKSDIPKEVEEILAKREHFRKRGDFQKADELRGEVQKYGYTIEDTRSGAVLKKIL